MTDRRHANGCSTNLRRGDVVAVRSLDEILATLDADAKCDGLPFMPEMVGCCGKKFRVFRRAEKTCVEGLGIREMSDAVLLEGLRCDGSAHDGCQRGCTFFWKNAWLNPQGIDETQASEEPRQDLSACAIRDSSQLPTTKGDHYFCQSTELARATVEFPPGKLQHYLHDWRIGELSLRRFAYVLMLAVANRLWRLFRGRAYYELAGEQAKTPPARGTLNLQPGEWVEVKRAAEIEATLDARGRNRGLSFEPEMTQHCGRRYRVASRLTRIIAEETGKMVELSDTVLLEGLVCHGYCAMNCPRANYFYWREIWLKRV